jgi:hypothetical protein
MKGVWFQPCTYQVRNWFQAFPFKCNLYRYTAGTAAAAGIAQRIKEGGTMTANEMVGKYV